MKQPVKEIQAFIDYDESSIRDSDDLISFKISCDSGLCKTAMRKLEANFLGNHSLLGKWVKCGYGVRLPDGEFEYLNFGSFLVTEFTTSKDTETSSIVAYDLMVNAMTPYQNLDIEYPTDLFTYTQKLCEACNLELGNEYFGESKALVVDNSTWNLSGDAHILDDGSLELTHLGSEADITLTWGKKDIPLYLQFELVRGGYYRCYIQCYSEDGEVVETIGANNYYSTSTVENNSLITIKVDGDDELYNLLPNTQYIVIKFYSFPEYASQPFSIKNVKVFNPDNLMNVWQIKQELWENIEGITYRDIFVQIAQATASTCIIHDDKVYFKPLADTGESLTYDNLFKLKLEDKYGEINSVVLSRTPSEDNIYLQNEASAQTNGLTEFKIENNEIIDKDRETAITSIFYALNGVSYYPFEATTEGLGWYEIGDNITIETELGEEYKTSLFNCSVTVDGSVKETLKTTAETKTQTQYQYATTLTKRLKNTEVIVNKQDQYIKQLVSDMYEENGVVNEKYTSIYQDIENIIASVQNSGGSNLIQNSVMFAYDGENNVANWTIEGDGAITINSDTNALQKGGISGHSFKLLDKKVYQTIPVTIHTEDVEVYYSFSTRVKKDVTGSCYVKLYNSSEEYMVVNLAEGESADYVEYELTGLLPQDNYYIVEFYGSADSNATFTDNMFAVGEYKAQWTQANGEVMNTQVNINLDGVTVKSSVYLGDYTAITPLEFAGYSNVSGTTTKVFSLNRDVTYIRKLLAEEEIAMLPIKVVAVTEGELQGWAFVPYVKEVE